VLVANEHEAGICAGGGYRDAAAFLAHMHKTFAVDCVITLGARGAMAMDGETPVQVASPSVDVVDTTGAGDAFAGAFAAALDAGTTLRDAMTAGARAGALCCTYRGAQREAARSASSG